MTTNSKNLPMGDGRPRCNRVPTSGSVGMGIPMGIPMGILVGMGWVWGLKCHPHGSPGYAAVSEEVYSRGRVMRSEKYDW